MKALDQISVCVLLMVMMSQVSDVFAEFSVDPVIPSAEYDGKMYYIHKDFYTTLQAARDSCAAENGKMVEFHNASEFDFVADYLESVKNRTIYNYFTYIGAEFRTRISRWALLSTGQPLPFTRFTLQTQREYDPKSGKLCLVVDLDILGDLFMVPESCTPRYPHQRFMCESVQIYGTYYPTQLPNADPNIGAVEYGGKIYYVHKKVFTDYGSSLHDCRADGGMVAEINSFLEFKVVQNYVKSFSSSDDLVFIGGMKSSRGWELPSTGESLPYVSWGYNEPQALLNLLNCLTLNGFKGWNMATMFCDNTHTPNAHRVLCEKPK